MKVRSGFHTLLRQLADSPAERSVFAGALAHLIRSRQRQLALVRPFLARAVLLSVSVPKVTFWALLAQSIGSPRVQLSVSERQVFRSALHQTSAYASASARSQMSTVLIHRRSRVYAQLAHQWMVQPPRRLFVFHHYDRRGYFPSSWFELLLAIQDAGWNVLISSSYLAPCQAERILQARFQLAIRDNVGLCLGAYKDLSLLLCQQSDVINSLTSLVLANDSTLPVLRHEHCLRLLESWVWLGRDDDLPVLAGLTDSAQRMCYHIQSFFLYANCALLRHPAWLRFWLHLSLCGTKDELINRGEIGLSQAMLAAGVRLLPAYPLINGLLSDPAMAEELQRFSIWQPRHVNQSLFAWQSLLSRGCPVLKKHVLFDLVENQGLPMAMAELARWIPSDRRELIATDLQELFMSRYSGGIPEIG